MQIGASIRRVLLLMRIEPSIYTNVVVGMWPTYNFRSGPLLQSNTYLDREHDKLFGPFDLMPSDPPTVPFRTTSFHLSDFPLPIFFTHVHIVPVVH